MWKEIVDIGKQVFALARELRQNKNDLKELRERQNKQDEEIKELRQELRRMAEVLQRLAYEYQRQNDKTDREREMLKDVEIMILRNMRGLPPPDKPKEDKSE